MRYKYDDNGSYFFHMVTLQPEYYLTAKEQELLDSKMEDLLRPLNLPVDEHAVVEIAEFGCGMGRKTLALLNGVMNSTSAAVTFVPVDISSYYLKEVLAYYAAQIKSPRFSVVPYHGRYEDYMADLIVKQQAKLNNGSSSSASRLLVFMGSSLGSYNEPKQVELLQQMQESLRPCDFALVGLDTTYKAEKELVLAYSAPAGWTAKFHLNSLSNVNKQLGSDFPVEDYEHVVEYVGETIHNQVRAKVTHLVNWRGKPVRVEAGTKLLMSWSDKFSTEKIEARGRQAGLELVDTVMTDDRYFMWAIMKKSQAQCGAEDSTSQDTSVYGSERQPAI